MALRDAAGSEGSRLGPAPMEVVHALSALSGWATPEDVRVVVGCSVSAAERTLTELAERGEVEARDGVFRLRTSGPSVADLDPVPDRSDDE